MGKTRRKKNCCADAACSVGKLCTYTLLRTLCSTSDLRGHEETGDRTQAVAGINSRIQLAGILGFRATQRRTQGNQEATSEPGRPGQRRAQEEQVGKYHSSSVIPVFQSNLQYLHSLQRTHHIVLGLSSINPSRCSECGSAAAASTQHEVIECGFAAVSKCISC